MAEVTVTIRIWHDEHVDTAELQKCRGVTVLPEMLREGAGFGPHARERRTRYEHAFERVRAIPLVHRRAFPAIGVDRHAAKAGDPELTETVIGLPAGTDLIESQGTGRRVDGAPMLRSFLHAARLDAPHVISGLSCHRERPRAAAAPPASGCSPGGTARPRARASGDARP